MAGRKPKYPCVQYSEAERELISKAKMRGLLDNIPEDGCWEGAPQPGSIVIVSPVGPGKDTWRLEIDEATRRQ